MTVVKHDVNAATLEASLAARVLPCIRQKGCQPRAKHFDGDSRLPEQRPGGSGVLYVKRGPPPKGKRDVRKVNKFLSLGTGSRPQRASISPDC
jgi:hypothetical protein